MSKAKQLLPKGKGKTRPGGERKLALAGQKPVAFKMKGRVLVALVAARHCPPDLLSKITRQSGRRGIISLLMLLKRIAFVVSLFALVALAACSTKVSATATIRIACDDPSKPITSEYSQINLMEMTSYDYAEQISKNLGLSKLWDLSDIEASTKLLKALKIQTGSSPDLGVIQIYGLEHQIAVKIINELCAVHAKSQLEVAPPTPKFNISIVQPAH